MTRTRSTARTTGAPVVIIDSGGANLASLVYALERLDTPSEVSSDPKRIRTARRVLLPGVGAAADAMQRLRRPGLHELIPELTQPLLGICLGMQLLYRHSEEGDTPCLGVIDSDVQRLEPALGRPVPHMGWNTLEIDEDDPLLRGFSASDYFYFVHSFAAARGPATLASVNYGRALTAVVRRDNFWGVQFHPERSGAAGARLLRNFLEL
ncbi:MAG TPA: imidazole glycerol phosphate synthase subunit HisH [Steroidobacteraceae bacterium]|nr:imidazole glycerol phosphate synthase subunit HisH [Steroidobacteraceae bacterium]